jgi:hypothetical protein
MIEPKHSRLNLGEVLALRGLRLPHVALKGLQRAGIYCQPAISIEFQQATSCYVIRGVESGGAIASIGAYCGFVDEAGSSLRDLQPVNTVGVNGLHGIALSPSVVRVQMFRATTTYELLVTRHHLASVEGKGRPRLQNSILFHGKHGVLEMELWGKDSRLSGFVAPTFYSRSGDRVAPPDCFHDAIVRMTAGVCCVGCRHIHVNGSSPVATEIDQEQPQ